MKSMTGYGRGDSSQDGFKITVELSSVNRKQSEISVTLPRELEMLEAQMRDLINRQVARGRLNARVTCHAGANNAPARMHLNIMLPLSRIHLDGYYLFLIRWVTQVAAAGISNAARKMEDVNSCLKCREL